MTSDELRTDFRAGLITQTQYAQWLTHLSAQQRREDRPAPEPFQPVRASVPTPTVAPYSVPAPDTVPSVPTDWIHYLYTIEWTVTRVTLVSILGCSLFFGLIIGGG